MLHPKEKAYVLPEKFIYVKTYLVAHSYAPTMNVILVIVWLILRIFLKDFLFPQISEML